MENDVQWKPLKWQEKYIPHIKATGKYSVEELMNDRTTTCWSDPVKEMYIVSVRAQIRLLNSLHEANII